MGLAGPVGASRGVEGGRARGPGVPGQQCAVGHPAAQSGHARRCVELGCRMLSIGVDTWFFLRGIKAFQEDYAAFFQT